MIVFYGRIDDAPLRAAIEEAARQGVEHLIVDQALLGSAELVVDVGAARVRACGMDVDLGAIEAVYARPLALPESGDGHAERFHALFLEWLDDAGCLVVNRPSAMLSNASKPFQIQLIAAAGLAVPETLVTNRPDEVRRFQRRHGRVIYKSTSGIRSIVRELDAAAAERLDRVRALPTQFQALVEGVDVRVHVVGDRCFAAEIATAATDYRYAQRDGHAVDVRAIALPAAIEGRCLALARELGLPLCGIDLRRRPDGTYVCFEVNPMPAFSYFEQAADQPIAAALVELMAGAMVAPWLRSART
jgi:glutathione synthase/RimK-type ligase-like ATP-grasp enzyme